MTRLNRSRPITVLGASGKTGRRLVPRLRAAGHEVRPASRTSAWHFDWDDRATWEWAVDGAAAVYVVAPTAPGAIESFVGLAESARVRRLVLLSGRGADTWGASTFGAEMRWAEGAVRAFSGEWTILRASNFNQNFDEDLFAAPLIDGVVALPIDSTPEPFVDVADVADVAVAALTGEGHDHRCYELTGPRGWSFAAAVDLIGRTLGRQIDFRHVTTEEYVAALTDQGWPVPDAVNLAEMFVLMERGLLAESTDHVATVLGRPATDFVDYVLRAASSGAWSP